MLQDKKYFIGSLLLLIAFTASVISYYLIIFNWIIYLLAIILILLSSQKTLKKSVTILLPILLYVPATLLFLYLYNYTSPKLFLIPKDYSGKLRIVYDENCGEKYGLENGKKVIKFPQDGILILNEKFDGGTNSNDEYYSYDENGKRSKNKNIIISSAGSMSIDYLSNGDNPKDFSFVEFYTKNSEENFRSQQIYDSITMQKVRLCRRN